MNTLAQLLANLDDDEDDLRGEGLHEAQIERLRETFARIQAGNKFKPGDLVMARKDAPIKGARKPHLVIKIDMDAPLYKGDVGNWPFAVQHNVIIISVNGGNIAPHAVPDWMLEDYTAEAR